MVVYTISDISVFDDDDDDDDDKDDDDDDSNNNIVAKNFCIFPHNV